MSDKKAGAMGDETKPRKHRTLSDADLEVVVKDVVRRDREVEALLAERARNQVGDVVRFGYDEGSVLGWALVAPSPEDDALFLAVPVDDNPLVGPTDVLALDLGAAYFTARCGRTVWLDRESLERARRVTALTDESLLAVRAQIGATARGDTDPLPSQLDLVDDPEYEAWLDEVAAANQRLENFLEAQARPTGPDVRGDTTPPVWMMATLAAASGQQRRYLGEAGGAGEVLLVTLPPGDPPWFRDGALSIHVSEGRAELWVDAPVDVEPGAEPLRLELRVDGHVVGLVELRPHPGGASATIELRVTPSRGSIWEARLANRR